MVKAYNFSSPDEGKFTLAANAFLPPRAVVPLENEKKGGSEILIQEGDFVKEGQVIAKSINCYVHAPISGKVEKVADGIFSSGKKGLCAQIALGGEFVFTGKKIIGNEEWALRSSQTLAYKLKESGIFSTFGKKIPLYEEIKNIRKTKNLVLIVRLFDDDPSILCGKFVSKEFTRQVATGALILAKASEAEAVVFVNDKKNRIDMEKYLAEQNPSVKIFYADADLKKYPFGTKHNLVSAAKKCSDDEILKTLGKNDLFADSQTLLHVYNAVVLEKPEISTFVHVTGDCLNSAAVMDVKIGTPLGDIVKMCGGFKRKLSKIIVNGTVKGISAATLDTPVTKSFKSVEFVPFGKGKKQSGEICVRCGNCRKVCPAQLWPGNLYRFMHTAHEKPEILHSEEMAKTSVLCMECGLCNSVCPARLPLSETVSILKEKINEAE